MGQVLQATHQFSMFRILRLVVVEHTAGSIAAAAATQELGMEGDPTDEFKEQRPIKASLSVQTTKKGSGMSAQLAGKTDSITLRRGVVWNGDVFPQRSGRRGRSTLQSWKYPKTNDFPTPTFLHTHGARPPGRVAATIR